MDIFDLKFHEVDIRGEISFLEVNNREIMRKINCMLKKKLNRSHAVVQLFNSLFFQSLHLNYAYSSKVH